MYILCTSSRYVLNGCSFSILRTTYVRTCQVAGIWRMLRDFERSNCPLVHSCVRSTNTRCSRTQKKKNVWLKSAAELASKIQKNIYYNRKHTLRDMQRCTDGEHFAEKLKKKITKRMKTKQNNNQNVQTTKTRDCQCR